MRKNKRKSGSNLVGNRRWKKGRGSHPSGEARFWPLGLDEDQKGEAWNGFLPLL